jgi:hypothetical protein
VTSPKFSTSLEQGGPPSASGAGVRLGLRANLAQFSLLVAVNALVGGMLGQERVVLPLLADRFFHLGAWHFPPDGGHPMIDPRRVDRR